MTSSLRRVDRWAPGHPIVFATSSWSDHREWEPQVRWFSRATGASRSTPAAPAVRCARDPEQYGWELAVADLLAVLDGLDVPAAHLVGLSMGGYVVLEFGVLRHPDRASAGVARGSGVRVRVRGARHLADCRRCRR